MNRLPWTSWKFWNQTSPSPKRRVHLGIDYGTSTSKIVFRVYGAPVGEIAVLVTRNGSSRIPSRVCVSTTELLFGADTEAAADCDIYESLKMRVAAEARENPKYYLGPTTKLPEGFSAADIAALTVWFLISEGHRAVAAHFNDNMQGMQIGMTIGVPMAFLNDKQLKASFLSIARRAWSFYCNEGLVDSVLLIEKAHRVLQKHSVVFPSISDREMQGWIRCEGEAAIWWLLNSSAVGTGPYAKMDLGASSTHANLFRIFGKVQTARRSLVPYGAAVVPVGMDAVGRAVAECEGLNSHLAFLGLKQSMLQSNAKLGEALMPVLEKIYDSYRKAWVEACSKISSNAVELSAWRDHKIFVVGGGSLLPLLVDIMRIHPDRLAPLSVIHWSNRST